MFSLFQIGGCASISEQNQAINKSDKIYTPTELKQDLKFLNNALQQIHPEPFARLDADLYKANYQQVYQDLSWPQRRQDFYRRVTPLITQFSEVHTRILYPQEEYQRLIEEYGSFPLAVLYSSDGLIVVADQQQPEQVPVGAEIVAINDIPIDTILEKFQQYVPGETDSGQRRMIQMEFSKLLWGVYQIRSDYQVDYLWQGKIFQKSLQGLIRKKPSKKSDEAQPVVSHYGAIAINDQTSLLWFNDFNEQYDKFEDFLDNQFKQLEGQDRNLILDLRYNQGGISDNLVLLLTFLTQKPVNWATEVSIKLSEPFRQQHSLLLKDTKTQKYGDYLDWLPVEYFNLWHWELLLSSNGELVESSIDSVVSDRDNYFTGKIFVLSNGYCFSACATLIATLQQNQMATIIGESPGSLTHVQYGYPVSVELPNTGLTLVVPAMKFVREMDDVNTKQVIVPDHQVERRGIDVLMGVDPVLNKALELSNR